MKVLFLDVDSHGFPYLPFMKLSAVHKKNGDQVFLNEVHNPHIVYISCTFPKNRSRALGIAKMFPQAEVLLGGTGINLLTNLPEEIEHTCPDYDLYKINYSLGFTSRGCIRSCPFCIIPKKEGSIKDHAPLSEFLRHDKVILLDNNFLASPKWFENSTYLIKNKVGVSVNQGYDVRLIDQEKAKLLSKIRSLDKKLSRRRYYFSWDLMDYESEVLTGIDCLVSHGIKPSNMMFYVLTGFNTSFEEDLYRVEKLAKLGVLPYVMRYNFRRDDPQLNAFARWVNSPKQLYKYIPFDDYSRRSGQ